MRFDKLTLKAQEALQASQELASSLDQQQIQPLHLLSSLLEQQDGVVLPVLQRLGGRPDELKGKVRDALKALLREYDGSVEGTEALNAATVSYVQAQVNAIYEIQGLKKTLGELFADSHTLIADFFLTNEQKAANLQKDAAEYQKLLANTLDPKLINDYAKLINQDLTEAFRLLSPEQQKAQQGSFLAQLDAADQLVKDRLDASTESITQSGKDQISIMSVVRDSLDAAAKSMIAAAEAMNHAADKNVTASDTALQAARTPVDVNVDSTVYVEYYDTPSQLGG